MRVLVTGASGLLGANLCLYLAGRHQVMAASAHHPLVHQNVTPLLNDLRDRDHGFRLVHEARPEAVIHCAALTDVDRCEREPELARLLNYTASRAIARASAECGARLIHISTDMVFDGSEPAKTESSPTRPLNTYGTTKLHAEGAVLEECPEALVVRTNIYGWNALPKLSLAEWALARLRSGQSTPGFSDVYFSPILVNDLAAELEKLLTSGLTGVVHVAGADRVSKYEFVKMIARQSGADVSLVRTVLLAEFGLPTPRPLDMSLDCSYARQNGMCIPGVEDGLATFLSLEGAGYPERVKGLLGEG